MQFKYQFLEVILTFIFQLVQRHDSHYYVMDRPLHYPKGTLYDFNDRKAFEAINMQLKNLLTILTHGF